MGHCQAVGWKDFQLESKLIQSAISTTVEFGDQSPELIFQLLFNFITLVRFLDRKPWESVSRLGPGFGPA